jgi:hypothetical protein
MYPNTFSFIILNVQNHANKWIHLQDKNIPHL